ncbi:hypothetical protein FRC00_003199 [Tulasnella sp. 408]|nr:hypothetical protein FRC00_003199 [Tulasnella sp. 408]
MVAPPIRNCLGNTYPEIRHQFRSPLLNLLRRFKSHHRLANILDSTRKWLEQRRLTPDPPSVGGKKIELPELFLLVGALGGWRAVSEKILWQVVGAKIGFLSFDGPMPLSKPEVAEQLAKVYENILADFEVHWHVSLRPYDASSIFPLPPHLQHLRPYIVRLAAQLVLGQQQEKTIEDAMRTLGFAGRTQKSLNPEERNWLNAFLRTSMQGQRQAGMGTPRMASGANPMMPGAPHPGPSRPQGGMPGTRFPQQFPPSQQMTRQATQRMKRPGSPTLQMDIFTRESSSPQKRLRKDSQNGSTPSMPSLTPGASGTNGLPQPSMLNGAATSIMMRPPPGAPRNLGQTMNPMMVNSSPHGGIGSNQTPAQAAQQFMNSTRPGSRSGTLISQVRAGSQSSAGMSLSRAGRPSMRPGAQARPVSQAGGLQQLPGAQGSPFTGPMPGPPGGFPLFPPQMVEQAMRTLGLHGRTQESLNPEERSTLTWDGDAQNGIRCKPNDAWSSPPRAIRTSRGNARQLPPSQQIMGQPPQQMKRPGSPSILDTNCLQQFDAPNESSPPQRRLRLLKDNQNSYTPAMPGFTPGAPGANGQQQPHMLNGAATPIMMRPPPGAPGNPGQPMNPMMLNGGQHVPPSTNPMQLRGPQQQGPHRPPMSMPYKAGGLVANPHQAGLPIPVKSEPENADNAPGPGSSANPQSAAAANAGAFDFMGADGYSGTDLDYGFSSPSGMEDPGFDLLAEFFDQSGLGGVDGDDDFAAAAAAAAGGSSGREVYFW